MALIFAIGFESSEFYLSVVQFLKMNTSEFLLGIALLDLCHIF